MLELVVNIRNASCVYIKYLSWLHPGYTLQPRVEQHNLIVGMKVLHFTNLFLPNPKIVVTPMQFVLSNSSTE